MIKFENKEAAFASQNYDPNAVLMTGVPEHIVEAAKAFINLHVVHDAVNAGFQPDYSDYDIDKYEAVHEVGSPSGAGFSCDGYGHGGTLSYAGARLASESVEACEHVDELCSEDYKVFKVYDRLAVEANK